MISTGACTVSSCGPAQVRTSFKARTRHGPAAFSSKQAVTQSTAAHGWSECMRGRHDTFDMHWRMQFVKTLTLQEMSALYR